MLTWALCRLLAMLVRLRVTGREHLRSNDGRPVVIVCNHLSWIDPLLIVSALGPRRPVVFLAAREHIERRRLLDWIVTRLRVVIKVERASLRQREVLRTAADRLRDGSSIALFPEGRINVRTQTGQPLLPFEPGAAVIARRSGVRILPLAISGTDELYLGRRVTLAIGTPLTPGPTHRDDAATMTDLHDTVRTLIPPKPPHSRIRLGTWLGTLE